jgi:hypothetical protein
MSEEHGPVCTTRAVEAFVDYRILVRVDNDASASLPGGARLCGEYNFEEARRGFVADLDKLFDGEAARLHAVRST